MTETMPLLSPAGACVVAKCYAAKLERLRPLLSPRRGTSCYCNIGVQLDKYDKLLSPKGFYLLSL